MSESWTDDFVGGSAESGEIGRGWSWSGTGSVTPLDAEPSHPGIVSVTTGTGVGDRLALHLGATASSKALAVDEVLRQRWTVRVPTCSGARVRLGLGADLSAAAWGAEGVYLELDVGADPNWQLVERTSSVDTRTDTGVAGVDDAWVTVGFRRLPGGWSVVLLDDTGGEVEVTGGGGAPPAGTLLALGATVETVGGGARDLHVDAYGHRYARRDPLSRYL